MAWFTRFTRFGDAHIVYAQEAANSCGIACVMMVTFKINKLRPGATAVHQEKSIYDVYSKASGASYDGSAYTYASHLASTLNKLLPGKWTAKNVGASNVGKTIIDKVGVTAGFGPIINVTPVIVLVGWTAAGAHFVVVDTVRTAIGQKYATVCDPWDGDVHVTACSASSDLKYVGEDQPLSWDLGGTRHEYTESSPGAANGWMIYRE